MRKHSFVFVALLAAAPSVCADIYKCAGENGLVVYKNFPCTVDSIGSAATAPAPKAVDEPAPAQAEPAARPAQVATAATPTGPKAEPRIGMTAKELKASSWGDPKDIIEEEVVEGVTRTWIYGGKRQVVVGTSGRVTRVEQ